MKPFVSIVALCFALSASAQVAPLYTFASPDEQQESLFGSALAAVGDLDGDGVPDVAVSAPDEDAGPAGDAVVDGGQLHVFSGATGLLLRTFVSPNRETDAFFGEGLLPAGDRDGDGTPDVYVSASRETVDGAGGAGRVYLLSGADGTELAAFASPDPQPEGNFGFNLARLGDLTGDGVGEVGVSANGERVNGLPRAGRFHIFDGATDALVRTVAAPDPEVEAGFGYTLDDAGDLDGDGTSDIVTGAPFRTGPTGLDLAGRLYFVSGADGSAIRNVRSPNETALGGFGRYVAGLGDVTGDGVPDVATGANGEPEQGSFAGRAYVVSGATGEAAVTLISPDEQTIGFFGELVEAAPDLDGDGLADLIVSARAEDENAAPQVFIGRVYVFSSDGTLLQTLEPPMPDPDGVQYFGYGIAALGDLDGDGGIEVGVGAWGENPPGSPPFAGRAYVFPVDRTTSAVTPSRVPSPLTLRTVPNPARSSATVAFGLSEPGPVRLVLFDAVGRRVAVLAEGQRGPGSHVVQASLSSLPAGVYVLRLTAGSRAATHRLIVIP
ncbi:MAG: T9SS type A sorting domain-containing protein [Bacteroidota bacterium]